MVLSSAESLAKRMAEAHGGKGRLVDDANFKALAKGLSLKANGIYYADPQATEWGMQINELSMGKLEGGLAKVYEIYKESLKEGIGMVSLFKVEKDGLLIEGNSTVNPYGGNIVHSIAGVGVAVASSLNDLQQSGLFDDLGGFGGPPEPAFDDDSDFDLPRVEPQQLPNLSGKWLGKGYKCWGNLDEDGQPLILNEIISISQDKDKVVATKITGDECVKAGEKTWEGKISGDWIEGVAYGRSPNSSKLITLKARIEIKSSNLLYLDAIDVEFVRSDEVDSK
jgi:hypothetical protein